MFISMLNSDVYSDIYSALVSLISPKSSPIEANFRIPTYRTPLQSPIDNSFKASNGSSLSARTHAEVPNERTPLQSPLPPFFQFNPKERPVPECAIEDDSESEEDDDEVLMMNMKVKKLGLAQIRPAARAIVNMSAQPKLYSKSNQLRKYPSYGSVCSSASSTTSSTSYSSASSTWSIRS